MTFGQPQQTMIDIEQIKQTGIHREIAQEFNLRHIEVASLLGIKHNDACVVSDPGQAMKSALPQLRHLVEEQLVLIRAMEEEASKEENP